MTLTGVTSLVLIPTFIKRHLKVDVFTGVHKLILGGAILSVIIYVVPKFNFFIVIIGAAASIAFYFIMLYYIGYISKEDINMIKARTKK